MDEKTMSVKTRYECLLSLQAAYLQASYAEKVAMLNVLRAETRLNRKYIITCLNDPSLGRHIRRNRKRGREYGPDVAEAIGIITHALGWICAERLKPTLLRTALHMIAHAELEASPDVLQKLDRISVATIARILKEVRPANRLPRAYPGRPPDTAAQRAVPVSVIPWDIPEPGHFEMDLVHHGVTDPQGHLVCTIQFIDVLTGWSERFGIMGTSSDAIYQAILSFECHCPIPIREVHSDNGSEFINRALIAALGPDRLCLTQTRGRPGYHNDNRFVEQKNSSLVRAYLGSTPLHTREQLKCLQALYHDMWIYYNLFQPVLRQDGRTAATGSDGIVRIRRSQDVARTPFDRLLEAEPPISRAKRERLQALMDRTCLMALKRRIDEQVMALRS
jgi:transposase InsO family protein